ncbi:MAG: hypothetical protein QOJ83_1062 [Frankiales bacterium]|nr:hypothetical protein [Frankiales bacterium]
MAVLLVAVLTAVLPESAEAASISAGAKPRCGPSGTRTLAANHFGRVFERRDSVYSCGYRRRAVHRIGAKYDCGSSSACGGVTIVKLAERWVGFAEFFSDGSTTVSWVAVVNMSSGHTLHKHREGGYSSDGQRTTDAVTDAIVLKRNGSIGWIEAVTQLPRPSFGEVHRFDRTGHALLDTASKIRRLRLQGTSMTWLHDGEPRSAPLD